MIANRLKKETLMTIARSIKSIALAGVCFAALGLTACAAPDLGGSGAPAANIKLYMQGMGNAYKAAMNSTNMTDFSINAALFQTNLMNASRLTYNGTAAEQAAYQQGMLEMKVGLAELNTAMLSRDLARSKAALQKMAVIRDNYHPILKK